MSKSKAPQKPVVVFKSEEPPAPVKTSKKNDGPPSKSNAPQKPAVDIKTEGNKPPPVRTSKKNDGPSSKSNAPQKLVVDLKTEVIKAPPGRTSKKSNGPSSQSEEVPKVPEKKRKLDQGIDGIMALIKKHVPKCKEDKKVVEPYEPLPRLWWQRRVCCYAFRHPKLRSRLERLMGSNLVHLTDRQYMLQLHHRILEDYIETMEKRIADREARERNREKELVLTGKIPLDEAPDGMKHHPILLINNYCQKLINERRAKIKLPKVHIHNHMYLDDTPDPRPGLTISEGHVFRKQEDELCVPPSTHLVYSDADDIERGYMFLEEDFERKRKYESPEVRDLENAETVEQMYLLADEIIGPLKTIKSVPEEDEEEAAAAT